MANWKFNTNPWVQASLTSWHWSDTEEPQNLSKHLPCKEKACSINSMRKEACREKKWSGRESSRNEKYSRPSNFRFLTMLELSCLQASAGAASSFHPTSSYSRIRPRLSHHFPRRHSCDLLTRHSQHGQSVFRTSVTLLPGLLVPLLASHLSPASAVG